MHLLVAAMPQRGRSTRSLRRARVWGFRGLAELIHRVNEESKWEAFCNKVKELDVDVIALQEVDATKKPKPQNLVLKRGWCASQL